MVTRSEDYSNFVHRLFNNGTLGLEACRNVTFQVTGDCNLRCSYCYEHHKSCGAMSLETGKRIVDYIIDLYEDGTGDFINKSTQGVVLDFIGGEPLLEAELIEKITDYWFEQCWKRKCPHASCTPRCPAGSRSITPLAPIGDRATRVPRTSSSHVSAMRRGIRSMCLSRSIPGRAKDARRVDLARAC